MKILVTGGCGFIGSAVVRLLIAEEAAEVCCIDKLTYSGDESTVAEVSKSDRYQFVHGDICDVSLLAKTLRDFQPDAVMHLAAETHVDRSIGGPRVFVQSNVMGTFSLLEQCLDYWRAADEDRRENFRFLHISTDEVFGELGDVGKFEESTSYHPRSPYSASKAASDHLVRAWFHTYGFPVLITNCSNNYGPYQYPEKLIPLMMHNALKGDELPVYGEGLQIRDWLHVKDHADALFTVLKHGTPGESYNVGGNSERRNIDVVHALCGELDAKRPREQGGYRDLIRFVADRPGHDFRYAIDASKISRELGWEPKYRFESGLEETVDWYLAHENWTSEMRAKVATEGDVR